MAVRDLGIVTAYGYAKAGGYTGTEQEFTALLGDLALTVEDLENMTVSVTTLEPNQQATASYADGVLSLGIPRGRNGEVTQDDLDAQLENYATNEALFDAYIVKSASGDIASFSDGGDDIPMKSLKVTIVPKQAGSGDPSPSNVRPISGWTDAHINISPYEQTEKHTITGKNLYNAPNNLMSVNVPCHIAKGTTITVSAESDGVPGIRYYNAEGTEIDYWTLSNYDSALGRHYRTFTTKTSMGDCEFVRFYGNPGTDYMIELGSTPSPYEPYGVGTPVPLGQTVYGGEVNPISGELVIDSQLVSIGDVAWSYNASYGFITTNWAYVAEGAPSYSAIADIYCSKYKPEAYNAVTGGGTDYCICASPIIGGNSVNFACSDSRYTSAADFRAANADTQLVFKLRTPTTVQLTPTQVATLLGTNNVWADCGSVAVEYRADPTLAYNGISPSIASVIAPVEKTNIATRNYTTGSLVIVNNTLYKVTANIANGGAITPNTNVTATTLAEIISAL